MNVKLIPAAPPSEKEMEFPMLMECLLKDCEGDVFLFLSDDSAVPLKRKYNQYTVGQLLNRVEPASKKCSWRKFEGKIELSN